MKKSKKLQVLQKNKLNSVYISIINQYSFKAKMSSLFYHLLDKKRKNDFPRPQKRKIMQIVLNKLLITLLISSS